MGSQLTPSPGQCCVCFLWNVQNGVLTQEIQNSPHSPLVNTAPPTMYLTNKEMLFFASRSPWPCPLSVKDTLNELGGDPTTLAKIRENLCPAPHKGQGSHFQHIRLVNIFLLQHSNPRVRISCEAEPLHCSNRTDNQ